MKLWTVSSLYEIPNRRLKGAERNKTNKKKVKSAGRERKRSMSERVGITRKAFVHHTDCAHFRKLVAWFMDQSRIDEKESAMLQFPSTEVARLWREGRQRVELIIWILHESSSVKILSQLQLSWQGKSSKCRQHRFWSLAGVFGILVESLPVFMLCHNSESFWNFWEVVLHPYSSLFDSSAG